jgi:V8-like Glu-specific endopeptidase
MDPLLNEQIRLTQQRWQERELIRNRNIRLIDEHRYFDADSPVRVKKFLSRRGVSPVDAAEILNTAKGIPSLKESARRNDEYLSLERVLGTNDLVSIAFLQIGLEISKTIGRIWLCGNSGNVLGYGTGFMVSPRLMLTNHHVLPDESVARCAKLEFRYELDVNNNLLSSEIFQLDPDAFYVSNEALDFALVAVKPENAARKSISDFGWNKLSKEEGKTIISQWLNIIQHPNGMPKQIGLRENQLIDVLDNYLHYKTDTTPGSSGSPVFNERWEVVALHHSGVWKADAAGNILAVNGGKWNQSMGEDQIQWIANEGVRVSTILKFLESQNLTSEEARLHDEMFTAQPPKIIPSVVPVITNSVNDERSSRINADGSVTFTVPVSITVNVGGQTASLSNVITPIVTTSQGNSPVTSIYPADSVLEKARKEFLKRPDVLNVRMGYVFRNGWITDERAIVITVIGKKDMQAASNGTTAPLPSEFLGYTVEVTGPTFEDLIAFKHGQKKLESLVLSGVQAQEITYTPPANTRLQRVRAKMKVIAHVSPEEGWKNLSPFLSNIKKTLTVGMYDFGSKHIVAGIEKATDHATFKNMTLTLQPRESVGEGTKADDLKDEEVVAQLKEHLGQKFKNAWVKIGSVNGWVSSSYHIKVAVKDSKAFWLSSGNWQSSNQPDIKKLDNQEQPYLLKTYNREWHAVVEHAGIAKALEKYILNDYENNKNNLPPAQESLLEELNFLVPKTFEGLAEEAAIRLQSFKPFTADRIFDVTPLLTPDNFYDEVIALVNSSQNELLIQNQTFNAPKENHAKLKALIDAVLAKQRAGVDVKIIFRVVISSVARENLEKLVDMGFDKDFIRIQKNCHNKGVVVDGKSVMLGSQNWSNDGVSVNRDASLLFHDKPLAQYFRKIFLHDWTLLAKSNIGSENLPLEIVSNVKSVPAGMELVSWEDVREML